MQLMPVATAAPETAVRQVAQVAVDARVGSHSGLFDYAVPDELVGLIEVGHRVRVPFGKRSVTGFVYALDQAPAVLELKPIEAMIDAEPVLPSVLVELAGFVASHYLVPLDEVIRAIVPPRVRAVIRRTVKRRRQSRILQKANAVTVAAAVWLEPVQLAARERISVAIARQESEVFLLHGVTGSGKTEVYLALHAADRRTLRCAVSWPARGAAQRLDRGGTGGGMVADPPRRSRHRDRAARGGVCAAAALALDPDR